MPADGGGSYWWAALPGGVVGSVITMTVREWLDARRSPKLRADTDRGPPFSVEVLRGDRDEPDSAQFLRIRVTNWGPRTAKNCRVFVTRVRRPGRGSKGFDSSLLGVAIPLRWAGLQDVAALDLPPGVPHFIDVAWTESSDVNGDAIYLRWGSTQPLNIDFEPLEFYPGERYGSDFFVDIVVAAEGCKSVELQASFGWTGDWHKLDWKAAARSK